MAARRVLRMARRAARVPFASFAARLSARLAITARPIFAAQCSPSRAAVDASACTGCLHTEHFTGPEASWAAIHARSYSAKSGSSSKIEV